MKNYLVDFPVLGDERGSLISLESLKNIPFEVKRVYYMYDLETFLPRGFHAHKNLQQILVCVNGFCKVVLDDGIEKVEVELDSPDKGLLLENVIWREMHSFSNDCVLMVLASDFYDENDYLRDYEEFIEYIQTKKNQHHNSVLP